MPIRMDLSKADSGFEVIPAGTYEATIFNVEQTEAKKTGRPMLKITLKLTDSGRQVFDYIMLDDPEKNAWRLKQLAIAAGIPDEQLAGEAEIDEKDLMGQPVVITLVVTQPKEGSEYGPSNNVRKYQNPATATVPAGSNIGW
jgi:hypothetical protein